MVVPIKLLIFFYLFFYNFRYINLFPSLFLKKINYAKKNTILFFVTIIDNNQIQYLNLKKITANRTGGFVACDKPFILKNKNLEITL